MTASSLQAIAGVLLLTALYAFSWLQAPPPLRLIDGIYQQQQGQGRHVQALPIPAGIESPDQAEGASAATADPRSILEPGNGANNSHTPVVSTEANALREGSFHAWRQPAISPSSADGGNSQAASADVQQPAQQQVNGTQREAYGHQMKMESKEAYLAAKRETPDAVCLHRNQTTSYTQQGHSLLQAASADRQQPTQRQASETQLPAQQSQSTMQSAIQSPNEAHQVAKTAEPEAVHLHRDQASSSSQQSPSAEQELESANQQAAAVVLEARDQHFKQLPAGPLRSEQIPLPGLPEVQRGVAAVDSGQLLLAPHQREPAVAPAVAQQQAVAPAAQPQPPALVRHDDEPMAFEELVGLQGPIRLLFENAGTVLFSSAMFMAGALWLPFTWGRITIRGIATVEAAWKLTVLPTAAMQLLMKSYQVCLRVLHLPRAALFAPIAHWQPYTPVVLCTASPLLCMTAPWHISWNARSKNMVAYNGTWFPMFAKASSLTLSFTLSSMQ